MDEFIAKDVTQPPQAAAEHASEPLWFESDVDEGPLRGFRQRWFRKRRIPDDDVVPSPSTALPDPAPDPPAQARFQTSSFTAGSSDHTAFSVKRFH